ncbi:hypothetical protein ACFU6I_12090 [Streptomyces sp. NPDC057486]|uniref:hypothetical protein n=1 Tax=Streptomyces sp. NPDC057486 TaxID=3346145 RepID=UPI0036C7384E
MPRRRTRPARKQARVIGSCTVPPALAAAAFKAGSLPAVAAAPVPAGAASTRRGPRPDR